MLKCKLVDSKGNPVYKRTCVAPLDAELTQTYLAQPCRDIRELLDKFIPFTPPLDLTRPISALYLLHNWTLTACIGPDDLVYVTEFLSMESPIFVLSSTGVLQRTIYLNRRMNRLSMCVSRQGDLFVADRFSITRFNMDGFQKRNSTIAVNLVVDMILNHDETQLFLSEGNGHIRVYDIQNGFIEIACLGPCRNRISIAQFSDGSLISLTRDCIEVLALDGHYVNYDLVNSRQSLRVLDNDQLLILDNHNTLWHFDRNFRELGCQELVPVCGLYRVDRFRDGRLLLLGLLK